MSGNLNVATSATSASTAASSAVSAALASVVTTVAPLPPPPSSTVTKSGDDAAAARSKPKRLINRDKKTELKYHPKYDAISRHSARATFSSAPRFRDSRTVADVSEEAAKAE